MNLRQSLPERGQRKREVVVIVASVIATSVLIAALLFLGFKIWRTFVHKDISEVVECVPVIYPAMNAAVQPYVAEFFGRRNKKPDQPPKPAWDVSIRGKIHYADTNSNCGLSLVLAYEGRYWLDNQKLYFQSPSTGHYDQIRAFEGKILSKADLLTDSNCSDVAIMAEVHEREYQPWANSLWKLNLRNQELRRIATGERLMLSPDRSLALFKRCNDLGFHSYHLLELRTGRIENVLSLWESDPGSGTSFHCDWSKDSKVVNIHGSSSGFRRRGKRAQLEFDLIYVAGEKKLYSIMLKKQKSFP